MSSRPTTRPAFFPCLPPRFLVYVIVPWPSPSTNSAATIILSHGRTAETQAHTANMKGCSEAALGRGKKSEEEAFLSLLSFLPPFSCLPLAGGRKRCHSRLHNSWETQEKTGHWVVKKSLDGGVEGYVCQSLCPRTHLPCFSPFITTPHTHSHCPMFVINLWLPLLLSRHVSMGQKSFHHVLANQGNRCFFLLMWKFWWTPPRQKSLTWMYCSYQGGERERRGFAWMKLNLIIVRWCWR